MLQDHDPDNHAALLTFGVVGATLGDYGCGGRGKFNDRGRAARSDLADCRIPLGIARPRA